MVAFPALVFNLDGTFCSVSDERDLEHATYEPRFYGELICVLDAQNRTWVWGEQEGTQPAEKEFCLTMEPLQALLLARSAPGWAELSILERAKAKLNETHRAEEAEYEAIRRGAVIRVHECAARESLQVRELPLERHSLINYELYREGEEKACTVEIAGELCFVSFDGYYSTTFDRFGIDEILELLDDALLLAAHCLRGEYEVKTRERKILPRSHYLSVDLGNGRGTVEMS